MSAVGGHRSVDVPQIERKRESFLDEPGRIEMLTHRCHDLHPRQKCSYFNAGAETLSSARGRGSLSILA